ncbi:MAG: CPBP family intramembrane metalloprotease [Thermoflexales bacterium]|nr:CPBP family intramembrane metalloprotease [Thermoflexales bacterium]
MNKQTFDWKTTPQLSIWQVLLATFIPSGVAFIGFHVVLPGLVANGLPVMVAWPAVASVMLFGFVILAFILLQREAARLGLSLWTRMCLKGLAPKEWALYGAVMVGVLIVSVVVQGILPACMDAIGFGVPNYMPFFLNPAINANTADMAVLSPGLPLSGRYDLLPLLAVTLLLNILTEEFYFRAWMLPKLARYGEWSWVFNGVLFAFYHTFQLWLLPVLLVNSLGFAFVFYRSKSVWPPLAAHLIGNFFLGILSILMLMAR